MPVTPVVSGQAEVSNEAENGLVTLREKMIPALCAAGLGAVLLFGAGFASMEALHNAAHDSRHSAGFPCH
ncbi:UNVERIFIED_ORG: cobalt transporter subunit CbtB [Zoogloea ramigera]|uniref:CbtB domain-containing protein n=1 Tax=Duganella zoogloeoides TaxID=75659 RepID=A0ABZ0Y5C8_9BURK|nr:CbtB domain-containing protein [Duganella zoogloeoides]WQH07261.1 CbtB domain-containing protein [Duganella zoogloeoides]